MDFGLYIPQGWRFDLQNIAPRNHWTVMNSLAAHADAGPWESIWVYDHFHTSPVPSSEATHEAWTLMAAFAASTSRVKLGQMCTCIGYRNPAYLAKIAATVDIISGGRAQMGIGAGWYQHEWDAYGYGFPRAGVRLGMLNEGVQIMRQAWREGVVTHDGEHYQIDGAIVEPRPLQSGGLPLWISGGGEKVTLRIAARYATHTNFDGTPEAFKRKSEILAGHCRDVGTDFDELVRSANYNVIIGESDNDVKDRLTWLVEQAGEDPRRQESARNLASGPLVGTPQQIVDTLNKLKNLGMSYAITYFPEAAHDRSGIELFEKAVIPALTA